MARTRVAPYFDNLDFPEYSYQEYPRMLYGAKGTTTVNSKAEADALRGAWFKDPGMTEPFGNALEGAAQPQKPIPAATGAASVQPQGPKASISTPASLGTKTQITATEGPSA